MSSRLAFQTQLASIMEVLANAAVAEICKLVDDDYAVVSLQMSQCQRENKALKRKLHLLELKMARGTAERRLRESALNNSRLRVQISGVGSDRIREVSPSADGFDQPTVSMWPDRALTASVSDHPRSTSPDVQLVEPEPVIVKEEAETKPETKEEVHLIEDSGIMQCSPHVLDRPKHSLDISPSTSRTQTPPRASRRNSATNRGVEEDGEPDLVLVKVEEAEVKHNQTGLIIQEVSSCQTQHTPGLEKQTGVMAQSLPSHCLVESSTDDLKASSTNQLQEPLPTISEVSFGTTSLWTNNSISDFCADQNFPGTSSQISMANSFIPASNPQHFPNFEITVATGQLSNEFQAQDKHNTKTKKDKKVRKKNFACDFCAKRFSSPANLESHLRTHTGEKPFACNICGKMFSQFWNMKIHKNIHTGERPYQCSVCPERFSDPSNLKKHEKRHYLQKNNVNTS